MKLLTKILYYLKAVPMWTILSIHNTYGILSVFFITWVRPMKGGMVNFDDPLVTGINPETNDYIWKENVIFASQRKREFKDTDDQIVVSVGKYMCRMIYKSAAKPDKPFGDKDRMPPSINYIHGGVQYNGGFLIFDDVEDARNHFSNKEFRKHFWKFIHTEKREPVTILRDKNYDREEFLQFVCYLRTLFPYFSNSNGNKKRIGWGNPAPFASVNTITGYWKDDTFKFYSKEKIKTVARAPIAVNYFTAAEYLPSRNEFWGPELYLANFTNNRVIARGEKGNLFFVDLRKIVRGYKFDPANLPNLLDRVNERLSEKIGGLFNNV